MILAYWADCTTLSLDHTHDLDLGVSRSESEIAISQEWGGLLTWNEKDVSHPFMTMILTGVTMVGWADVPDSERGDFRRRRAVDISSLYHVYGDYTFKITITSPRGQWVKPCWSDNYKPVIRLEIWRITCLNPCCLYYDVCSKSHLLGNSRSMLLLYAFIHILVKYLRLFTYRVVLYKI